MFRDAAFIARKDLSFILRQRETLVWLFGMPILFFYFIGTVTGNLAGSAGDGRDNLALEAPAAGDPVLDALATRLEEQKFLIVRAETDEEFMRFSRRLTISPPASHSDVTAAVVAGEQVGINFVRRGDSMSANFDQVRVARATYGIVADLAVLKSRGKEITAESLEGIAAEPRGLTLAVRPAGTREEPPAGFAQAVPGTMVMFTMIIILTSGAVMLIVEREHGLLARLASTPISRGSVVLGKWTARMAVAVVQIGFAMVVGRLVFKVDWGPSLPMVILVMAAWASFNASLGLTLANIVRTQGQMIGIGVLVSMLLAALGGAWWPIEITPESMQTLAKTLPSGWAMDALHKLVNFGYGPSSAVPHLAALSTGAVVLGAIGARIFRYT